MLDLAAALEKCGVEPQIIVLGGGDLEHEATSRGVVARSLPLKPRIRDLPRGAVLRAAPRSTYEVALACAALARYCDRENLDLLHTNSLKAHVIGTVAGSISGTPTLWHLREVLRSPRIGIAELTLLRLASRRATAVVAVSRTAATAFGPPCSDTPMPPAVDIESFTAIQPLPNDPPARLRLVSLGRFTPEKGHDVVAAAARILHASGRSVHLTIAGAVVASETECAAALLGSAEPYVRVIGHQREVRDLMQRAHIVVQGAVREEGFGRTVVEALASGRHVVAPEAAGPAEILSDLDGARTYRAGNAVALAREIAYIHDNWCQLRPLAAAGPRVAERYAAPKVGRATASLYSDVVRLKRARRARAATA
jgi:glycosyltransferase involved in cell wall biosynthesis